MSTFASTNTDILAAGKATYDKICAACHAKDLSGGAGFNLKDEEWVHGDSTTALINNISQGFPNAGMPAFKHMLSTEEIKNVAQYIQSQRQGFSKLSYKIYAVDEAPNTVEYQFDPSMAPTKTGVARDNLIDFSIPEAPYYIIEYSGILHNPITQPTYLFAAAVKRHRIELEINGKAVEPAVNRWQRRLWPIAQGKHNVTLRFFRVRHERAATPKLDMYIVNESVTQKLFAVSESGKRFMAQTKVPVLSNTKAKIVRKKIVDLPANSIAVGHPNKLNFAFNTKTCQIVGAWSGDLLNVGPNVERRGRDASIPLGTWLFKYPKVLGISSESQCRLIKYSAAPQPTIVFEQEGQSYSLTSVGSGQNKLHLQYALLGNKDELKHPLNFTLPQGLNFVLSDPKSGTVINEPSLAIGQHEWQIEIDTNTETKQ
ncbi:c-type cytochrome [Agaribacter flavus]|uniref:C-type cytochrome n=1 Tax=Agaribacter flavus TaxID=1902781 RepID=A0ABV7FT62_9ALTE